MKLQPNFAFVTSEKKPDEQTPEQARLEFQSQLESQHIEVANSVNSTIDDESFFTRERQTAFTWVVSAPKNAIWKVTIPTVAWVGGPPYTNTMTIPIADPFTVIFMFGTISNGTTTVTLPHVDSATLGNSISVVRTGTTLTLTSQFNYSAFSGFVTIYYTKP